MCIRDRDMQTAAKMLTDDYQTNICLLYTSLLHDINAIFKREYNTFLSGTNNMLSLIHIY